MPWSDTDKKSSAGEKPLLPFHHERSSWLPHLRRLTSDAINPSASSANGTWIMKLVPVIATNTVAGRVYELVDYNDCTIDVVRFQQWKPPETHTPHCEPVQDDQHVLDTSMTTLDRHGGIQMEVWCHPLAGG